MTSKLTVLSHFALAFILLGMGAHVLGFVTDFWCSGSRTKTLDHTSSGNDILNENITDAKALHVNLGLFRQQVEYAGGMVYKEETALKIREEQILILAIAGTNTLLCLILYIRAIHIFVGISSFIIMSLMLLSAFYTFEHTNDSLAKVQAYHSQWPKMALSWSFICVFAGLLVNIISTVIFLSIILIKGERKASKSSKGLGPSHVLDADDKTPIVSVISGNHTYENEAFTRENQNHSQTNTSNAENASTSYPVPDNFCNETDIVLEDKGDKSVTDSNDLSFSFVPGEPFTDLDAIESDNEFDNNEQNITSITESIRL
ncbi:uncharacterized protein LOC132714792 [Ruditapes philippinarum]|uniref:uncharacterized protein LOC132714792 n=1 Tax=Ruditapes philippinarum TaxID=129788 RepID=UPI00295AD28A|nr:uncharacterized protein LOC132714792 [Ruditapes philippinarum]